MKPSYNQRACLLLDSITTRMHGALTLQELNLNREFASIEQAVNIHLSGDWERQIIEYLADL